jgi:hypothetical protein
MHCKVLYLRRSSFGRRYIAVFHRKCLVRLVGNGWNSFERQSQYVPQIHRAVIRKIEKHQSTEALAKQADSISPVFFQVSCMELSMDLESDCIGFEQVQGLGSAATNSWPCLLDRDLVCTTNHGFDIFAHGSQTHTETWETFAGTCKRHAQPRGTTAARLLECGPWTCNHFA